MTKITIGRWLFLLLLVGGSGCATTSARPLLSQFDADCFCAGGARTIVGCVLDKDATPVLNDFCIAYNRTHQDWTMRP